MPPLAGDVLNFIEDHEKSRKRSAPATALSPRRRRLAPPETCTEELAAAWVATETAWWAQPRPKETAEATASLAARSLALHRDCSLVPDRLVSCCIAGLGCPGKPGAPLLTAWCLHEADVLPLLEWCGALSLPDDCAVWGEAMARLHERALEAAGAPAPMATATPASPHARLLQGLCRTLLLATTDEALPRSLHARGGAILRAYVERGAESSGGAAARLSLAGAEAGQLRRVVSLLRCAAALPCEPARACAAGAQLRQLVRPAAGRGAAGQNPLATLGRVAARLASSEAGAGAEARADGSEAAGARAAYRECAELLGAALGESRLQRALFELPRDGASAVDAGRWLGLVAAARGLSAGMAAGLDSDVMAAAVGARDDPEAGGAGGASLAMGGGGELEGGGFSLAGLILVARALYSRRADDASDPAACGRGYAEWLARLAQCSDCGAGGLPGGADEPAGKRAVAAAAAVAAVGAGGAARSHSRVLRALCELVPVQCAAELKLHLKVARGWPSAPGAAAATLAAALQDYMALLRTRLVDLQGPGAEKEAAALAAAQDEAEAASLLEAALRTVERDGVATAKSVPAALLHAKFMKQKVWKQIVALVLAPSNPPPRETAEARQCRLKRHRLLERLKELLRKGKHLPEAGPPARKELTVTPYADRAAALPAAAPFPSDWVGLLDALPSLAVCAAAAPAAGAAPSECAQYHEALAAMRAALRPPPAAAASVKTASVKTPSSAKLAIKAAADAADAAPPGGARLRGGAALHAAGSLSALLRQLLSCFAACLHEAGAAAGDTWPAAAVENLLWAPQRAWPELHRAFWGWVRVAVAGAAGAHERPLALLLLHLGALQRAELARAAPPAAAAAPAPAAAAPAAAVPRCEVCEESCEAHARLVLSGGRWPAAGGCCQVGVLLTQLPLQSSEARAWSMRLGASCVELACSCFDHVELGLAPRASWEGGGGGGGSSRPRPSLGVLPARMLQLMQWLAQREAAASAAGDAERAAAATLGRALSSRGAAALLEAVPEAEEAQRSRWAALAHVEEG